MHYATVTCDDNTRICLAWKHHVKLLLLKLSIRQPGCSSVLIICFLFFYLCTPILIFFYFLQSDWLQERAAFYDILTVVQKNIFSDKQRSKDNFQTQNTTRKIEKSALLILNIVRYSEFTSMGIVPSPKCTFLGPKCEKTQI